MNQCISIPKSINHAIFLMDIFEYHFKCAYVVGCSSFRSENGSNSIVTFSISALADAFDLELNYHLNYIAYKLLLFENE